MTHSLNSIPKELWISFTTFRTLRSVCSSFKHAWEQKENTAKLILIKNTKDGSMDALYSYLNSIQLTCYQFCNLLMDERNFHILAPIVSLLIEKNLSFGIEWDYYSCFFKRKLKNKTILVSVDHPTATYFYHDNFPLAESEDVSLKLAMKKNKILKRGLVNG